MPLPATDVGLTEPIEILLVEDDPGHTRLVQLALAEIDGDLSLDIRLCLFSNKPQNKAWGVCSPEAGLKP